MNSITTVVVFYLLAFSFNSWSQNGSHQIGARIASLGYTGATSSDEYSVFNNPAGLSEIEATKALAGFENRFGIAGLNNLGAAIVSPLPIGSGGISLFRFGDDLYNEQVISMTYSHSIGITQLGAKLNYMQFHLEGFGTKGVFVVDFGGITALLPDFKVGAYIRNINQAKLSNFQDERVPTLLNLGFSYKANKKVLLNTEIEKDIDFPASLKIGFEYEFLKKFAARLGVKTNEFSSFFGLGFKSPLLTIDYAIAHNFLLGSSHQASISYLIRKK